jgi:hypothetical protein
MKEIICKERIMPTIEEIKATEKMLQELKKQKSEEIKDTKIFGFTIKQYTEKKKNGNIYNYWRGHKAWKGKKYIVKIQDPLYAKEKILEYLEKNPELQQYIFSNYL